MKPSIPKPGGAAGGTLKLRPSPTAGAPPMAASADAETSPNLTPPGAGGDGAAAKPDDKNLTKSLSLMPKTGQKPLALSKPGAGATVKAEPPAAVGPPTAAATVKAAPPPAPAGASETQVAEPAPGDAKTGKLSLQFKKTATAARPAVPLPGLGEDEGEEAQPPSQTQAEPSAKRTVAMPSPAAGGGASATVEIKPEEIEAEAGKTVKKKSGGLKLKTSGKPTGAPQAVLEQEEEEEREIAAAEAEAEGPGVLGVIASIAAALALMFTTAVLIKQFMDHCQ